MNFKGILKPRYNDIFTFEKYFPIPKIFISITHSLNFISARLFFHFAIQNNLMERCISKNFKRVIGSKCWGNQAIKIHCIESEILVDLQNS